MRNPSRTGTAVGPATTTQPGDRRHVETDWNPQLAETLCASLSRWMGTSESPFDAEIVDLEGQFGEAVYSEAIFALSHLRMPPAEARRCWREIMQLREEMGRKLESFVDLRVALAAYFLQVNQKLRNPKMIEMQLFERTHAFAYRDDLTGLYNHRFFEESLTQELLRSERSGLPVSLAILDVDDFKKLNDALGHEGGNELLASVAALLVAASRPEDILARYGGEEFAMILPATRKTEALDIADRTRGLLEHRAFAIRERRHPSHLTASVGIATFPGDAIDASSLIRCADRALYAAKAAGKNQVQLYDCSKRSFARVPIGLDGSFRTVGNRVSAMKTLDVSDGGMLFTCAETLAPGSLIEFELQLPEGRGRIPGVGRVVHTVARPNGTDEVAVRVIGMEVEDRRLLSRFVADFRPRDGGDDHGN